MNINQISNQNFQSKPKISVIVPVYNQEKYLDKSLSSLQKQSLKDIEIICINDGSTDRSLEILKRYSNQDNRFKVFDQKNQGIGITRNRGLNNVKGEYVAFLDPDDWIEKDTYEKLYTQAKKQNCDMLAYDFNIVNENEDFLNRVNFRENIKPIYEMDENKTFTWKNIKQKVLGGLYLASWNKIYNKDFLNKNRIKFVNCSLAEDHIFVINSTLRSNKIGYSPNPFYNYRVHNKSAVNTVTDRNLGIFRIFDIVKNQLEKIGVLEDLSDEFDKYVAFIGTYHFKNAKSKIKYLENCKKKLSPKQCECIFKNINDRQNVLNNLFKILESIKLNNLKRI